MGNINIADSAIVEIVYRTLTELFNKNPDDKEFKKYKKGIQVERTPEDNLIINLKLDLPYGVNVKEFASNVMKNVAEKVYEMTEKNVESVNVFIQNIVESSQEKNEEEI